MNENNLSEIVLFESSDGAVSLDVQTDRETVWLSLNQISSLFDRDKSTISRHIKNVYEDRELDESSTVALIATVQNEGGRTVEREVQYYNLDVIISVGYRVKSQRGVEFRRWATDVLRRYIIDERAENELRLQQLSQAVSLLERISDSLDTSQVLEIVKSYALALDLLDDYDHQRVQKPGGNVAIYILDYDECKKLISTLRFNDESDLFGVEKDDSFKSSIATIYQSFGG